MKLRTGKVRAYSIIQNKMIKKITKVVIVHTGGYMKHMKQNVDWLQNFGSHFYTLSPYALKILCSARIECFFKLTKFSVSTEAL